MDKNDVAKFVEVLDAAREPVRTADGYEAFLVPEGYNLETRSDGETIHQTVTMHDAESFCAYVKRFKSQHTQIFADVNAPVLRAIIDYHNPNGDAGLADHQCIFAVAHSEEWKRWREIDGKVLSQAEFADFVEENYADIHEPEPAKFLEIVTNVQNRRKISFSSGIRLSDGTHQISFTEEDDTKAKGYIAVPSEFTLALPIFNGGARYKVRALLRYRIKDGRILFVVKLHRKVLEERAAFADICEAVENSTLIKPYMGRA